MAALQVGYELVGSPDSGKLPLREYAMEETCSARYVMPCCLGGASDAFLACSDEQHAVRAPLSVI